VLIFPRPHALAFEQQICNIEGLHLDLVCVQMPPTGGEPLLPYWGEVRKEDFTSLPGGGSCVIPLRLTWGDGALDGLPPPPSPGEYWVTASLRGASIGPKIGNDYYDIGAWVGVTNPSNVVTLTILPANK
jgi:hypothetical protein